MSSSYQGDGYGAVSMRVQGDRLTGTATGGPCGFEPDTEVLSGEFQDNVLVGQLLLCQVGPQCEPRVHQSALVVFNPEDGAMTALFRLKDGCRSPSLKNDAFLLLRPLSHEADATEPPVRPASAVALSDGAGSSAAQVAAGLGRQGEVPPLEEGQRQLASGNAAVAQRHFELALERDPRNASAVVGLGASQLALNDVGRAVRTLEAGRGLARADVQFWLAYAYHREGNRVRAREALRKAFEMGWTPAGRTSEAAPEQALREDIKDLDSLMQQQRARKRGPVRAPAGAGNSTP
ncbi:Tetratricopeptide repeat domain protein [Myxococcus hansupus]|uniref:Tetratricopeptide repeat domain protein n=1 Tax=Pseudomyxococcus hansupus TaxID=1297742 RepID=A0A0H4X0K9_9BACT|nr:tetratricopeptide repeat protein [Myxococcus hansupus]AKQ67120.1 Tetratricopeptide repeat domain protein [Myxococcus hansupus]